MSNNTCCKECVFAEYDDVTQTGCKRGMIDKYRSVGSNIIEAYDKDKEFYVIPNRLCPFFRKQSWIDRIPEEYEKDIESILKLETTLAFHVIILVHNESLDDIHRTIDSLIGEEHKPIQITIIRHIESDIRPRDITDSLKSLPIKWRTENLVVKMQDENAIHMVQKTLKSNYYSIARAGFIFPAKYLERVNKAVIEDLIQFGMIEIVEGDDQGIILPLSVHEYWYFHGDAEKTIPECLRDYQCQNPTQKIVYQLKSL